MVTQCGCGPRTDGEAIRLLVVDDHDFVRATLAETLESEPDMTVVGECADGGDVVAAAARFTPDVVLMDLSMPTVDGITATERLLEAQPGARVIMLTSHGASARARAARAGARAFVVKSGDPETLIECIRSVATDCCDSSCTLRPA